MKKECCPKCNSRKVRVKMVSGEINAISCPVCGYLWEKDRKAQFVEYD